jgi:uroporphyrinogen-III synthase
VVTKKKASRSVLAKKPVTKVKASATKTKKTIIKKAVVKPVAKKVVAKAKKAIVKKVIKKAAPQSKVKLAKKTVKKEIAPVVVKNATPKVASNLTSKTEVATTSTEKFVKVGVKTKKQLVAVAPQPVIEVSNYPKHKVKTILISQPKPENDKNPYYELSKKYNLIETFRQFIKIEGIPVKDFRSQRIDILEHKAVILTSRMAVDHYFRMCNEMRVTVPESMKYFCINEATAYYLQKYIQYRKRKIFFGHQTIQDLVDVIRKNREEKFLLPAADVHKEQICEFLDAINIKYTKAVMYRTVSADLSDIKNLNEFDILAFFTPAGINSLKQNFPNFKQGNTRIACFGAAAANTLKKHGYRLDIYAPNPKNPSMSGALDEYIKEANKR